MTQRRPPRFFKRILSWAARPEDRPFVVADLEEEFTDRTTTTSSKKARAWYRRQVLASVLPLLRHRLGSGIVLASGPGAWGRDLMRGVRTVPRSPAFSLLVVAVMAAGIGATTAVFSVTRAVVLRPLPFEAPQELVAIRSRGEIDPARLRGISGPDFFDFRSRMTSLSELAGYEVVSETLSGMDGPAQRLSVAAVSHTLFSVLARPPMLGRGFTGSEDHPDGARVVVLSSRIWQERFGGERDAIGRDLILDGRQHTVVGVMPASFQFPARDVDLWRPLRISPSSWRRSAPILSTVGRIAPGGSVALVETEFTALADQLAEEHPQTNRGRTAIVAPLSRTLSDSARPALFLLLGAVSMLLILGCANVANLLLARAGSRRGELAVRTALGANRGVLVRQLIGESLTLAVAGGALGAALAWVGVRGVLRLAPPDIYRLHDASVDWVVLSFAASLSVAAGLLFGAVPAFRASEAGVRSRLVRGRGALGRSGRQLAHGLMSAQVTVAMVLVVSAGLFGRSLNSLLQVDPGIEVEGLLAGQIDLPDSRYPTGMDRYPEWPEVLQFYQRATAELNAIPGVVAVAMGSNHPLQRSFLTRVSIQELDPGFDLESVVASPWSITPDYARVAGMTVLSGRDLDGTDRADAPRVALVNKAFVDRYVPERDPIGLHVTAFGEPSEIVGVVTNVAAFGLGEPAAPIVFQPVAQAPVELLSFVLRTTVTPDVLVPAVRQAIWRVDPEIAPYDIETMTQVLTAATGNTRLSAGLLSSFGGIALLLATLGIFGVLAESVEQRKREIGVRIALGARPYRVLAKVIGEGLAVAAVGLLAGTTLALVTGRLFEAYLHGVGASDPATLVTAAGVLVLATVLAAAVPATRAATADPVLTLRDD